MRQQRPTPGGPHSALDSFLARRMPPSSSTVSPLHRETTVCYAYMCHYAYACTQKSERPAQVLMRRCMRYLPEAMRVEPQLSDFALDLMARGRQSGQPVSAETGAMLDRLRPNGPIRKSRS